MVILRAFSTIISVALAVLAGNWTGSQLRAILTGRPAHAIQSSYQTARGATIRNIPVITKFYPALLFVVIGKPRWLFAFIGGFLTGSLVDNKYEDIILERIDKTIVSKTNLAKAQVDREQG